LVHCGRSLGQSINEIESDSSKGQECRPLRDIENYPFDFKNLDSRTQVLEVFKEE